jgi:hypothetical protein
MGEAAPPVAMQDIAMAQIAAEQGKLAEARARLAAAMPLVTALPPGNPITPQFDLSLGIVELAARDKAAANAALDKAEAGFKASGPAGSFGLQGVAKARARVGKLP